MNQQNSHQERKRKMKIKVSKNQSKHVKKKKKKKMDWSYLSIFWHKYQNKPSSTVQDCHSTARFVLFRFVC
jgi:hypothetical protein